MSAVLSKKQVIFFWRVFNIHQYSIKPSFHSLRFPETNITTDRNLPPKSQPSSSKPDFFSAANLWVLRCFFTNYKLCASRMRKKTKSPPQTVSDLITFPFDNVPVASPLCTSLSLPWFLLWWLPHVKVINNPKHGAKGTFLGRYLLKKEIEDTN